MESQAGFEPACDGLQPPALPLSHGDSWGVRGESNPGSAGHNRTLALRTDSMVEEGEGLEPSCAVNATGFRNQAPPHWGQPLLS